MWIPRTAVRAHRRGTAAAAVCLLLASCGAPGPAAAPAPTLSAIEIRGQAVFTVYCAACHATAPDTVIAGPSLAGIVGRAGERIPGVDAESYLRASILDPAVYLVEGFPEAMPPDFGKQLSGEEFDAVLAYLLTLK